MISARRPSVGTSRILLANAPGVEGDAQVRDVSLDAPAHSLFEKADTKK